MFAVNALIHCSGMTLPDSALRSLCLPRFLTRSSFTDVQPSQSPMVGPVSLRCLTMSLPTDKYYAICMQRACCLLFFSWKESHHKNTMMKWIERVLVTAHLGLNCRHWLHFETTPVKIHDFRTMRSSLLVALNLLSTCFRQGMQRMCPKRFLFSAFCACWEVFPGGSIFLQGYRNVALIT